MSSSICRVIGTQCAIQTTGKVKLTLHGADEIRATAGATGARVARNCMRSVLISNLMGVASPSTSVRAVRPGIHETA